VTKPYRDSLWRRALNAIVRPAARLGLAPGTYLLTVEGRVSGKPYSTPVLIVEDGDSRWLVAPYGERNWVKNARAAGELELRRGRKRRRYRVEELEGAAAVRVLKRYYRHPLGLVTHPYFDVSRSSPDEDWLAEAPRHPVFLLHATP
jgi:deazaflavin-dependent oxidoreductase (nitroreductase family)